MQRYGESNLRGQDGELATTLSGCLVVDEDVVVDVVIDVVVDVAVALKTVVRE